MTSLQGGGGEGGGGGGGGLSGPMKGLGIFK